MFRSNLPSNPVLLISIIILALFLAYTLFLHYGLFIFIFLIILYLMKEKVRNQPLLGTIMQFCGIYFIYAALYIIPGIHFSTNIAKEINLLFGSTLPPITLFYLFLFLSALCFALGHAINLLHEINQKLSLDREKGS